MTLLIYVNTTPISVAANHTVKVLVLSQNCYGAKRLLRMFQTKL